MDAADVLDRAADVIEERGHCKGRLEDEQGRVCLVGATFVATTGEARCYLVRMAERRRHEVARDEALHLVARYVGVRISDIVDWNNAPEREEYEVVNACRHAAKVLRGG